MRETNDGGIVHFHDEAEFRVSVGAQEVRVTLGPATESQALLAFVLAALPLALPLFDLEPFHGAGLELPGGQALLVLGHPEAGKSTTAAALRARGLRFLADDACAIDEAGLLWPGAPLLAAEDVGEGQTIFDEYDGKKVIAISGHDTQPRSVHASVVLRPGPGSDLAIRSVRGQDAIVEILAQARSPRVMSSRRVSLQLATAARLAGERVGVVTFDKASHLPNHVAETIARWVGGA